MIVSVDEVKKLAELARIELTEKELVALQNDIDSIVSYINCIQEAPLLQEGAVSPHLPLENVMREDVHPYEPGLFTERMLEQAPKRNGAFIQVKKILGE
jgi:aspartyl-tRNA(Asn)/glutamyl-tRNA(Gln) amidotransferase subunit C